MMIDESEIETDWSRGKKARVQGRFLKGPIPFAHLTVAAKLPGHALNVLLATYHQTALTGKEWVTLPKGLLSDLGVSRDAKSRALGHLQTAGIVEVKNDRGKPARVRLLELHSAVTILDGSETRLAP
jgi:hypothetical protein